MFSENELLAGCLKNSRIHQKAFYDKYAGKMYALCLRYANDDMEAEDYLQEGFMKVYDNLAKYRNEGSLEGWVRRVIVNLILQKLRKKKQKLVDIAQENIVVADTGSDILSQMAATELLELIRQLPAGYRTIFNLYVLEEYSHKDIAKELGISEGTSKSQLSRARIILQKMVLKHESIKDIYYERSRENR